MIDIENQIFTNIRNAIKASTDYSDIVLTSDPSYTPAKFPCVFFCQSDSYPTAAKHTSSREDRFETVVFEAYVYSNKTSGAKTECKKILSIIDEEMRIEGFTRTTETPLAPAANTVKAIRFARYRAEASSKTYIDESDGKPRTRNYIFTI